MSSDRFVALYAIPDGDGSFLRFVGDTAAARVPIRPFWMETLAFEDWQGRARPETIALCRKLGIDVLFLVHIQRTPRGKLLCERLEEIRWTG